MRFNPPQEYSVNEPERLGLELTLLADQTETALGQLETERAARWKVRKLHVTTFTPFLATVLDELLILNTEDAGVTVILPKLGPLTSGRGIAYVRTSASNTLKFQGSNGALINGAATFTAAAAVGRGVDLINDGTAWWTA